MEKDSLVQPVMTKSSGFKLTEGRCQLDRGHLLQ